MSISLKDRDRLYSFDFSFSSDYLLYLLGELKDASFFSYNLSAYKLGDEWRYLFEFAPEHPSLYPIVEQIAMNQQDNGLSWYYAPLFAFSSRPSVSDYCKFIQSLGSDQTVTIRSLITQPIDLQDSLLCIVVPDSNQSNVLKEALKNSQVVEKPFEFAAITCYVNADHGASQPYCELQDAITSSKQLYSSAISWCQDYRIVEIAYDIQIKSKVKSVTDRSSLAFEQNIFGCAARLQSRNGAGTLLALMKELIADKELDIISVYSGIQFGAPSRTLLCVSNPDDFMHKISQNRGNLDWQ